MEIQGLKMQMSSEELKATCLKRAEYHQNKANALQAKAKELEPLFEGFNNDAEAQGKYTSGNRDVLQSLNSAYQHHTDRAMVFRFYVEHIVPDATYILNEQDLRTLEVMARW